MRTRGQRRTGSGELHVRHAWSLTFLPGPRTPGLQAQFSHMGASTHLRTAFTYRVPEDAWACFFTCNLLYALGPHLLAYRCLRRPAFFLPPPPPGGPPDPHKKKL